MSILISTAGAFVGRLQSVSGPLHGYNKRDLSPRCLARRELVVYKRLEIRLPGSVDGFALNVFRALT